MAQLDVARPRRRNDELVERRSKSRLSRGYRTDFNGPLGVHALMTLRVFEFGGNHSRPIAAQVWPLASHTNGAYARRRRSQWIALYKR